MYFCIHIDQLQIQEMHAINTQVLEQVTLIMNGNHTRSSSSKQQQQQQQQAAAAAAPPPLPRTSFQPGTHTRIQLFSDQILETLNVDPSPGGGASKVDVLSPRGADDGADDDDGDKSSTSSDSLDDDDRMCKMYIIQARAGPAAVTGICHWHLSLAFVTGIRITLFTRRLTTNRKQTTCAPPWTGTSLSQEAPSFTPPPLVPALP
jgi:hypothetical protein